MNDWSKPDGAISGAASGTSRRVFLARGAVAGLGAALAAAQPVGAQTAAAQTAAASRPAAATTEIEVVPGAVDDQGNYVLPPLPYDYAALEPHIDAETLRLHHDKHHAKYVAELIDAEKKLAEIAAGGDLALAGHYAAKAAFNGAGHYLHCIYWASMSPKSSVPSGTLAREIDKAFGSFDTLQKQYRAIGEKLPGSGWSTLAWSLPARKLVLMQVFNHENGTQWANIPLLILDVWEHAYYKKYSNDRVAYVNAYMEVCNWEGAGQRLDAIRAKWG